MKRKARDWRSAGRGVVYVAALVMLLATVVPLVFPKTLAYVNIDQSSIFHSVVCELAAATMTIQIANGEVYGIDPMRRIRLTAGDRVANNTVWWGLPTHTTVPMPFGNMDAHQIEIPLVYPCATMIAWAVWLWCRKKMNTEAGHCRECGYHLTGLDGSVCPECGSENQMRGKI